MGQQELEAALRREGEEKARAIWRAVESEADRLRSETAAVLDRQQQAGEARRDTEVSVVLETARSVARKKAQRSRLVAESNLADRLKLLADQMLETLALRGGEGLFSALVDEIPEHDWFKVMVHPRDRELARSRFPTAEIVTTERISGGLKVENLEGRIVIINSLEKRIEHLWPGILPVMLREFRQMKDGNEAVA